MRYFEVKRFPREKGKQICRTVKSRKCGSKRMDFFTMIGRETGKGNTLLFWMEFKGICRLFGDEKMGNVIVGN